VEYVIRRGGSYHYRRRFPADLVAAYGRKEFQKALGTSDIKEARTLRPHVDVEFNNLCAQMRAELASPVADVDPLVAAAETWNPYRELDRSTPENRAAVDAWEATLRDEATRDPVIARILAEETIQIRKLRKQKERSEEMKAAIRAVLEEQRAYLAPPQPVHQPPGPMPATHVAESPSKASSGLMEILTIWQKVRQPDVSTVGSMHTVLSRFHDVAGKRTARSYTRQNVVDFQESLAAMGLAPATIRKQLSLLSALFSVDPTIDNPAKGIKTEGKEKRGRSKPPFDHADLNLLFASPIYTEGLRPVSGCGEAAYWLPLLGTFTGARLEELGQLSPKDIRQETYRDGKGVEKSVPVIYVTDEGEGQGIKNSASYRRIPVHKALIELGFLKYVAAQKGARLFPAMVPDKNGRETSKFSSWFPKYLRAHCPAIDNRKSFHSFRHFFKDMCRELRIDKDVRDAIQGHAEGDAAGEYGGELYPLRPLVQAMDKFKLSGVKLPNSA
jgi:integrase